MTIWRDIDNHSRYEVSNNGQVRRKENHSLLSGGLSSQGYPKVHLTDDDGKKADHNVHVLEARAFYGDIPGARIVHLSGVKTDNRLRNLHPQISDPVLAQAAFQRALRVRRARAVRHGDGL
ncbi:HNH endonuclease [Corynebacterium comes]|nr:HNH endonuclease [Corynebacterium comes]